MVCPGGNHRREYEHEGQGSGAAPGEDLLLEEQAVGGGRSIRPRLSRRRISGRRSRGVVLPGCRRGGRRPVRRESTTGNIDLHARQYNPATGRFNSTDPVTRSTSTPHVSPYAYADNRPTLPTDRSGRTPEDPNDSVDGIGDVLGIFGDAFADVVKSPFVFLGDAQDAFTGKNGGDGAFLDKYLPVRPAYRLYRAEYMLRQQGCDALADLYAEAADELTQQIAVVGVGGLTGWRRAAVNPGGGRYHGEPESTRFGLPYYTPETASSKQRINPEGGKRNCGLCATAGGHRRLLQRRQYRWQGGIPRLPVRQGKPSRE
ncbi:hypothetical protein OG333_29000 [Streptomyces anulatus]|uniref:RHS repeat-associated core domain-containing protein n=1 Tax=Streptomyces anulatus TaxID=1892 RepID=UPI0034190ED2|nr:hypothetical protein OG333_29000 [Streptomyces anulatus]